MSILREAATSELLLSGAFFKMHFSKACFSASRFFSGPTKRHDTVRKTSLQRTEFKSDFSLIATGYEILHSKTEKVCHDTRFMFIHSI